MGGSGIATVELEAELERIITRMQKIQRNIRLSGQPASMGELAELKKLGTEYARVVDRLANTPGAAEQA